MLKVQTDFLKFNDELKLLLKSHKMSQKELAMRLGLSLKHMNTILKGDINELTVNVLEGLEYVFNLKSGTLSEKYYIYKNKQIISGLKDKVKNYLNEYGINFLIQNPQLSSPFNIYIQENMYDYEKLMSLKKFYGVSNLEDYKLYLDEHVLAEFKKFHDKPNTYVWIRFCELGVDPYEPVGTFRSNEYTPAIKKALNIMSSNKPFNEKISLLKTFLRKKGIVLVTKKFIEDSMIRGITIKKGAKRFIFLSDMYQRECFIFFTLLHEIVHCYFPKKTEEEIDNFVIEEYERWEKQTITQYKAIYDAISCYNSAKWQTQKNPNADVSYIWESLQLKYPKVTFEEE
ncbi:helix-turn-helix domain-containing protein [Mycoplasma zalophi]|uniref:Helix-turn-helix transcriptional regulator n=1 Tax=Mycoplasma zalophi TaxID=191287 RepID=A0ABS6DQE1_9MOLU|nr:helix-turn-helix transcriptional regulator [Mycoplasma zalophi]MBU4691265.1 helix-turn-helix transcriptional regulator [Mycoplasma zalophi]MBU4692529.1 helix-turn-helix transcriptional regulator [Mycoplasma zalophi]